MENSVCIQSQKLQFNKYIYTKQSIYIPNSFN